MEFSNAIPASGVKISPDGKLTAAYVGANVVVREVSTLILSSIFSSSFDHFTWLQKESTSTLRSFSCDDSISRIEWSSDSQLLLCTLLKINTVQVWSVEAESCSSSFRVELNKY